MAESYFGRSIVLQRVHNETMIDNTLISLAMTRNGDDVRETKDFVQISQLLGETTACLIEDFIEDEASASSTKYCSASIAAMGH